MAVNEKKQSGDFEEIVDPRNDLAVERTELALERTHLAWIRTTLTLITAGLAIDKVAEFIHQQRVAEGIAFTKNAHIIGISLTCLGTFLLLLQMINYIVRSRQLANMKKGRFHYFTSAIFLSFTTFFPDL